MAKITQEQNAISTTVEIISLDYNKAVGPTKQTKLRANFIKDS